jgi:hypothetical protein
MATYAISDIHGCYDQFMELLNKISPTDTDTIYKVRFTYWLEGFDADCFDAVFGQTFDLAYTFDMAQNA